MKKTILRFLALKYANGDQAVSQPTGGVARPLERAGLIVWHVHKSERVTSLRDRGWGITSEGKVVLAKWKAESPEWEATK